LFNTTRNDEEMDEAGEEKNDEDGNPM